MSMKNRAPIPDLDKLKECLSYDTATGLFTWKKAKSHSIKVGQAAGFIDNGYVMIRFDRHNYGAHRLAWFYTYGEWPPNELDHVNRDRSDNRITNLRLATASENQANRGATLRNSSGFKGVTFHKGKQLWMTVIRVHAKRIFLGYCRTAKEAGSAYNKAAREYFGEFFKAA